MRDYDMEEFLIHYGTPGMKRPRGLKYRTKGNGSTSLYANRRSQMYGRNRTDDSDKSAEERERQRYLAQEFKNKTSSVRGKMAWDKLTAPAAKSKKLAEENQTKRKENAKKLVNLPREMHNTAKKANATMRNQKKEAAKKKYEQDKPKLMENMRNSKAYISVIGNYNNIQKRRKLQNKINTNPTFRSELSKYAKDAQTVTLNNLGIKTTAQKKESAKKFTSLPATNKAKAEKIASDPRNYQNQTLSNLGIKKKKKKKS